MIDRSLNYGRHLIGKFLVGHRSSPTIIDLGAGSGADLEIARQHYPAAELHALEYWPPNIAKLADAGVTVHQLNIERDQLPFSDSTVDVVIANQVLEHTKELFWIFHETSRVLSTGGAFIIGVPNLASLHNRLLLAIGRQPTSIKSASAHVRGFTAPDLIDFVERAFPGGYRLEQLGGSNFYPFPAPVARPLARLFPTLSWGIFLKFTKQRSYEREFIDFPRTNQLETNFYVGRP